MGDDFDLFPKRENLDPFSFGKKEKTTESDTADSGDELFGQEEKIPEPLPDLPSSLSPDPPAASPEAPAASLEAPPPLPDLPLGEPPVAVPPPASGMPPLVPPPPPTPPAPDAVPDLIDGILSDGPISEEKTFDEPVFELFIRGLQGLEEVLDEGLLAWGMDGLELFSRTLTMWVELSPSCPR